MDARPAGAARPIPGELFGKGPAPPWRWRLLPPIWMGMTLPAWLRLLRLHRFRISPCYWPRALLVTLVTPVNTLSHFLTWAVLGRRLARARIASPLFVVGHWRSGTTLLHELLALDRRFAWPDGFACFCPAHFLWSRPLLRPLLRLLQPKQRPMDSMTFDMELPQEDEFGLVLLGAPSPYEGLAFPNRSLDRSDPDLLPARERSRFLRILRYFLAAVSLRGGGRPLLLKSPPHMARLDWLAEAFPDLKAVHIVRDPRAVFPSVARLSGAMLPLSTLDARPPENYAAGILEAHALCFRRFEAGRQHLRPGSLMEIRYEDLVANPIAVLRQVYAGLELDWSAELEAALRAQVEAGRFRPARLPELTPRQRETVESHCADMMRRYGYL